MKKTSLKRGQLLSYSVIIKLPGSVQNKILQVQICLSELHPEYMPLNKWNHGFAWVELDNNGKDYQFHNKRIYKGIS